MHLADFMREKASQGIYHFTSKEAANWLKISGSALNASIYRMKAKKYIVSPSKNFYLIIPPEYLATGCLPPDQFIPHLMRYWNLPYYVALLSAAEYYGAAHQRPQTFQVIVNIEKPMLRCGRFQVQFITKKNLEATPTQQYNTAQSMVKISTPEATAMDLVRYLWKSGGLNNIVTVLSELAEKIDPEKLNALAEQSAENAWIQRLGYILSLVGRSELAQGLEKELERRSLCPIALNPSLAITGQPRDPKWSIVVNDELEGDL